MNSRNVFFFFFFLFLFFFFVVVVVVVVVVELKMHEHVSLVNARVVKTLKRRYRWRQNHNILFCSCCCFHLKNHYNKLLQMLPLITIISETTEIWASSWDYGTYDIGYQRPLRRACAWAQSRKSLRYSHTQSMEVDEGSDQKSDI